LLLGAAFITIIIVRPWQQISSGNLWLWGAIAGTLLALAIWEKRWVGMTAAVLAVIVVLLNLSHVLFRLLPDSMRRLSPHAVDSPADVVSLMLQRCVVLGPALLVAAVLALAHRESRQKFVGWCRVGSWNAPIRWPLPWWGVPSMPLWCFLIIAVPSAAVSLLPAIDGSATADRFATLPLLVWMMIPLAALTNALLEEGIFRLGLISICSRCLTPATATIPAALMFGAVHFWGGLPSGLFSLVLLSFGGFWLGYFMLAENGLSAAVFFHTLMDVVVFSLVVR
jgi:membrane protease YdiL (CAAX protease family)